jgi:dTMP kinase
MFLQREKGEIFKMFITFEGLDFSGKSTQATILVERLKKTNPAVHFLREPGGTTISERIRDILLDKKNLELNDAAELLLFSAARAQLVKEIIVPAIQRGEIVVCDRYYDSTTAYQGFGRGINTDAVKSINRLATGGTDPDITFFVDIPVDEIESRKQKAGMAFDRMESSGRAFYERVRSGYYEIARSESHRFVTLNGLLSVEELARDVWEIVEKKRIVLSQ